MLSQFVLVIHTEISFYLSQTCGNLLLDGGPLKAPEYAICLFCATSGYLIPLGSPPRSTLLGEMSLLTRSCGGGELELPRLPDKEAASCLTQALFLALSAMVKPRLGSSKSGSETSESDSLEVVLGGDKWSATENNN